MAASLLDAEVPQLAPLALPPTGVLALVAATGLANGVIFASVSFRSALLILVAIALSGATLQATILHYRGRSITR